MLWILGTTYAGKVDHAAGLFFVKTLFRHVYWVPILPVASYLLWDDPERPYRGVRIPLCWRSVIKAWLWLYPIVVVCLLAALVTFVGIPPPSAENLTLRRLVGLPILAIIIVLPIWLWRRLAQLSTARARELAALFDIPEVVVEEHRKGRRDAVARWLAAQPLDASVKQSAPSGYAPDR